MVAGWEFIEGNDWGEFSADLSNIVCKALYCKTPPPGSYTVVVDHEVVGLLPHEAFGHASEGDTVSSGASILMSKLGAKVASGYVTIIDEGVVDGGYFTPYDDEGTFKGRTVIVENGVLKTYLYDACTANRERCESTGNPHKASATSSRPFPNNLILKPGDYELDEMIEETSKGVYVLKTIGEWLSNTISGYLNATVTHGYLIVNGLYRGGG